MDVQSIILELNQFIAQKIGVLDDFGSKMLAGYAVIYLMVYGAIYTFSPQKDVGEFIGQALVRLSLITWAYNMYDLIFVGWIYNGWFAEVISVIGSVDGIEYFWQLALRMESLAQGSFSLLQLIPAIISIIGLMLYCVLVACLVRMTLTLGFALVIGKGIFFLGVNPWTEPMFMGWLKYLIGNLVGMAAMFFFMAAIGDLSLVAVALEELRQAGSLENIMKAIMQFLVAMFTGVMLAFQSYDVGKSVVG